MRDIIILGANGNAIDVAEAIEAGPRNGASGRVLGFLDDNPALCGRTIGNWPVLGSLETALRFPRAEFINAIGSPENFWQKPAIIARAGVDSARFATVIHPKAWVSPSARLGRGVAVLANATIGANAQIGDHVIILPNAVVSHDDRIGDYSCIGSGACISGNVVIGKCSYIGSRSTIRGHVCVSDRVLVGMGAVVLHDVPDNQTIVGSPARFLRHTDGIV